MADVFLSYAREDRARAEQVAQGLAAVGIEVFWDSEIPPGQTWADFIETKLSQCRALIVLWSEHSTKSQWVREEARMGRDKGVLIPAMIDASQAPFGFGEVQAANLAGWSGEPDHADWCRFVAAVRSAAASSPTPQPQPQPAPQAMSTPPRAPPQPSAPPQGLPVWVWVTGAIVGTIVVLGIIRSMLPDTNRPAATNAAVQPAISQPAAPATADQSPQTIILAQLQQAQGAFAQQGFQQIDQPFSGSLAQGQTWNVPASLFEGFDYRVLAVCDRDCADLDLVLYDPNGAVVSQDASTNSQPVVAAAPGYNGTFTVQVQMYNCSVAPCYYAVALYGRAMR